MSNSNNKIDNNNQNTLVGDPHEVTNSAHLQDQIGFSHDLGALKQSHVDIKRSQERIEADIKNCVTIDEFKASSKVTEGLVANVDKLNSNVAEIQANVAVLQTDVAVLQTDVTIIKENQIKLADDTKEAIKNAEERAVAKVKVWAMTGAIAMLMIFISHAILLFRTF